MNDDDDFRIITFGNSLGLADRRRAQTLSFSDNVRIPVIVEHFIVEFGICFSVNADARWFPRRKSRG